MNGIYSLYVDRQVVIHTRISFYVIQLGGGQVAFPFYSIDLYQAAFLQQVEKRWLDMAYPAVFIDYD